MCPTCFIPGFFIPPDNQIGITILHDLQSQPYSSYPRPYCVFSTISLNHNVMSHFSSLYANAPWPLLIYSSRHSFMIILHLNIKLYIEYPNVNYNNCYFWIWIIVLFICQSNARSFDGLGSHSVKGAKTWY